METFHQRPQLCPACGYMMDAATNAIGKGDPKPGDYSLCLSCGAALEYGLGLLLTKARQPLHLPPDQLHDVRRMQQAIRQRGPLYAPRSRA